MAPLAVPHSSVGRARVAADEDPVDAELDLRDASVRVGGGRRDADRARRPSRHRPGETICSGRRGRVGGVGTVTPTLETAELPAAS